VQYPLSSCFGRLQGLSLCLNCSWNWKTRSCRPLNLHYGLLGFLVSLSRLSMSTISKIKNEHFPWFKSMEHARYLPVWRGFSELGTVGWMHVFRCVLSFTSLTLDFASYSPCAMFLGVYDECSKLSKVGSLTSITLSCIRGCQVLGRSFLQGADVRVLASSCFLMVPMVVLT